jgi:hypothetical protein
MKPVIFDHGANLELTDAVAWYEGKKAGLGLDLQARIDAAIERIRT